MGLPKPQTLRELGAVIGSKVRFCEDPKGAFRIVETDAQLDYKHLLPWQVIDAPALPERYGNRKVPKMLAEISAFQQLVMAEGTPAIQDQWDKIVQFIDFLPQEVARRE